MRRGKNTKLNRSLRGIIARIEGALARRFPKLSSKLNSSSKKTRRKLSKHAPKHLKLGLWLHDRKLRMRLAYGLLALLVGFSLFSQIMTTLLVDKNYELSPKARAVIGKADGLYGNFLKYDVESNSYQYNPGFTPSTKDIAGQSGRPKYSASFNKDPAEGVKVDDPFSKTSLTIKPKFPLAPPKQVENRLLYPIKGQNAAKVYTMQAIGFKEDIVLNSNSRDSLEYKYELELASGTEARLEPDGSVGVYGVRPELLGNVATGSEKDAQLLEKARANSEKNTLLYRIPAPEVREFDKRGKSDVKTWFTLEGNELTVHAENLKNASYPLSIDPSVYIETAAKLMRGNNETNIDFDIANELIQKGSTTGARFNSLTGTMSLTTGEQRWNHGTAVAGGYVYVVGGNDGTSNQSSVHWAKFDPVNFDIESTNPGEGTCADWCTNSDYDLPAARAGLSLVAYNGFLYAIGGNDSSCTTGNGTGENQICGTVYIAKLGANGEPSLWHPSDTDPANWVYWYRGGDLSTEREYTAAVAYDNRMYLFGGRTDVSGTATAVDDVERADVLPMGNLGSWTSATDLSTNAGGARFGHSAQVYNDYLYVIGGNIGGTLQSRVDYIKVKSDGSLASSWANTSSFTTARQSWGGNFSTIWGAYIYIAGGCAELDTGGECSTNGIANGGAIELASINADGSLSRWGANAGVTNARIGHGMVAWRNTVYSIGGCTAQNLTTGACTTTTTTTSYGIINPDGDASNVSLSQSFGNGNCVGSDPYQCDLPPAGDLAGESGQMLNPTAIMNGYIYVIGGCAIVGDSGDTDCEGGPALSSNTSYAAISSDGTLHRSPTCIDDYVGSWCVDNTNLINGTTGLAGAATAVFEGHIYVIGGFDESDGGTREIARVEVNADGSLSGGWTDQDFDDLNIPFHSGVGSDLGLAFTFGYARANPASAATYPGNLYIFGGCNDFDLGVSCDGYSTSVFKCNIEANGELEEDDANDCDTTGQLQIDAEATAGSQGLGIHSGTVYANYIYLVGGNSDNIDNRDTVLYAKFDNNNNVVAVDGSGNWKQTTSDMSVGRQYGAAFGYNGFLYVLGGYDSGGAADNMEFAKINVSTGDIEAFTTSTVSISGRWGFTVQVTNSYVYVIGGCDTGAPPPPGTSDCSSFAPSVQTFQIHNNESGTPAGYSSSSNLFATDRFGAGVAVHNGFIYIAGGCIGQSDCDEATNGVEYAPLQDDGTIGTWATTAAFGTAGTDDRVFGQLEVAGGTLYFIGGQDDNAAAQEEVFYATPASNGTISSWATATNGLPGVRVQHGAAVWNDRIYVTGGGDGAASCTNGVCNTVYVSPPLSSGGNITSAWSTSTAFNVARMGHTTIAYANNLYVLGGFDGANQLNDVQFTQINSDGTIDGWTYTTSLPQQLYLADGFAANGYMYLFGGKEKDLTCNNNTFVAPISANTTIASGNNPTGIGEWFVTNERFTGERSGASAVYHQGKAYVLGGACGTLAASTSTVVMEDDFDANVDGTMWSNTDDMNASTECGTLSSGNAFVSEGDDDPRPETKDVSIIYGGTISFYLFMDSDTSDPCDGPDDGNPNDEGVVLEYSINGGVSWVEIAEYPQNNFDPAVQVVENIPDAARTGSTRFRWYIPDADGGEDQWAIDDVEIRAFDTPPVTTVLEDDFDPSIDGSDWADTGGFTVGTGCGQAGTGNSISSEEDNDLETIDMDLHYGGVVTFNLLIPDNGSCNEPEDNEELELQYSLDGGDDWDTLAEIDHDNGGYTTPTEVSIAFPANPQATTVRFRWIMPEADPNSDTWIIDDVNISVFGSVLGYTNQNRVVFSSLLSQPQLSKYSRMIDTDSDVFPTYWLLNGIDNSIGARWFMRYRSMTNPLITDPDTACVLPVMSTWGQDTNFGEVDLGTPEDYIPLDGSGNNTNCARYFFLNMTIDSSQAYGYPEDISRGPTITDLTLFFTADPSKRMRHGKTFTGGELQPLDTPF